MLGKSKKVKEPVSLVERRAFMKRPLKIKPDKHEALSNWGIALSDQAKTKTGAEADALFGQAGQKFEAAVKIIPDFYDAFYNWGTALFAQTKTKTGAEADVLFDLAAQKFEAAVKIKPDKHEALNNWALRFQLRPRQRRGRKRTPCLTWQRRSSSLLNVCPAEQGPIIWHASMHCEVMRQDVDDG